MDMICVVIDFFDSKSWVVFSDFVELLFYMFPYPFVRDNVTTVFGYQHYVVITEVDAVVGSYVFFLHVTILTHGIPNGGYHCIPRAYATGNLRGLKKLLQRFKKLICYIF